MSTPSPRRTPEGSSRPMTERTVTGPPAGPAGPPAAPTDPPAGPPAAPTDPPAGPPTAPTAPAAPPAPRPPAPDDAPPTARRRAKAERRDALLSAAARLFARRGFDGVSLEDLGSSAGISGPAVYRH